MAPLTVAGTDELRDLIGQSLESPDGREVTQEMMDTFVQLLGERP